MTANTDQVKKTIRDLFNLAENDAATEGEIDNAIRHARRLLDLHHLSEEECRKDPAMANARAEMLEAEFHIHGTRVQFWEMELANFVKHFVGSVAAAITSAKPLTIGGRLQFDSEGREIVARQISFGGTAEDATLAVDLYATLRETIATAARMKLGGTHRRRGRSYAEGFVRGLCHKLLEARRLDELSSPQSRALIVQSTALAKAAQQRASDWLQEKNGRMGKAKYKPSGNLSSREFIQGMADGTRTQVSAQRRNKITGEAQRRLGMSEEAN